VILRLGEDRLHCLDVARLRLVPNLLQVALEIPQLCQPLIGERLFARGRVELAEVLDGVIEDRQRLVDGLDEVGQVLRDRERFRLLVVLASHPVPLGCVVLFRQRLAARAPAAGKHENDRKRDQGCPPHRHYGIGRG